METFKISFKGRLVGSIGTFQNYSVLIVAKDQDNALRELYATHEHIQMPKIERLTPGGSNR